MKKFNQYVICIICLLVMVLLFGCELPESNRIDPADLMREEEAEEKEREHIYDTSFGQAMESFDFSEVEEYIEDVMPFDELLEYVVQGYDGTSFNKTAELDEDESYTVSDMAEIYGDDLVMQYYLDNIDPTEFIAKNGINDVWDLINAVGENEAAYLYEEGSIQYVWDGWDSLEYWYWH